LGNYNNARSNLPPVNNEATGYQVQVIFEGDDCSSATAYSNVNGTDYAVCTTIQYGYKPSSNSTMLTVEPQATQVMQPTKTPEQMQKEAEQSGWFRVEPEFSWWYPWYRLHVKVNINPMIDIGFNPILPGGETWLWDGLEFFEGLTEEVISDILLDVSGLFSAYLIARKLSIVNPALGLALEIAKLAAQSILLYTSDWQTRGTRLLGSSIGSIMMGLLAINMNIAKTFVDTLIRLCKWVSSAMMNLFTILMNILSVEQLISRWWMDAIEISGDFLLGGLGIVRYLGGI
jgi:hypothetical protein